MIKPAFFIVGLVLLTMGFACGTSKKAVDLTDLKPLRKMDLLTKLEDTRVTPEWLFSKGQIKYRDQKQSIGLSFSSILRKDSLIMVNIKKMGIVFAKLRIDPDSATVIMPMQDMWTKGGLSDILTPYGLPADFDVLQHTFLGNAVFITQRNSQSLVENQQYQYKAYDDQWVNAFWIDPVTNQLTKTLHKNGPRTIFSQDLDEYKAIENGPDYAYLRTLDIHSPTLGQIDIKIEFANIQWNQPRPIRFSIPEHYERY